MNSMICRTLGWVFILLALLGASAEAVMALGAQPHSTIAAGEVWTLLSGQPATDGAAIGATRAERAVAWTMGLPAWIVFGVTGLTLVFGFRRRPRRIGMRALQSQLH